MQKGDLPKVKEYFTVEGADVEAKNNDRNTPLIISSWHGHIEVVKFLITEEGADIEVKDYYGHTRS